MNKGDHTKAEYIGKKTVTTSGRAQRRAQRKGKQHIENVTKEVKLATHDAASQYYQLYLRHIGDQKAFQVWLSKVVGQDLPNFNAVTWTVKERINRYFTKLWYAIIGKL